MTSNKPLALGYMYYTAKVASEAAKTINERLKSISVIRQTAESAKRELTANEEAMLQRWENKINEIREALLDLATDINSTKPNTN